MCTFEKNGNLVVRVHGPRQTISEKQQDHRRGACQADRSRTSGPCGSGHRRYISDARSTGSREDSGSPAFAGRAQRIGPYVDLSLYDPERSWRTLARVQILETP